MPLNLIPSALKIYGNEIVKQANYEFNLYLKFTVMGGVNPKNMKNQNNVFFPSIYLIVNNHSTSCQNLATVAEAVFL